MMLRGFLITFDGGLALSDELLSPTDAAKILCITARQLRYMRETRSGPAYIVVGHRTIRYRRSSVDAFLRRSSKQVDSTLDGVIAKQAHKALVYHVSRLVNDEAAAVIDKLTRSS